MVSPRKSGISFFIFKLLNYFIQYSELVLIRKLTFILSFETTFLAEFFYDVGVALSLQMIGNQFAHYLIIQALLTKFFIDFFEFDIRLCFYLFSKTSNRLKVLLIWSYHFFEQFFGFFSILRQNRVTNFFCLITFLLLNFLFMLIQIVGEIV